MNPAMSSPGPNGTPFHKFLRWLSEDPEIAAKEYERIRKKVVRFFIHKGWRDPDTLFDITIDRVVKIVDRGDQYSSPLALCIGVAVNIDREKRKKPDPEQLDDYIDPPAAEPDDDKALHEQRLVCMERCLDELPREDRDLLINYHKGDGRERINGRKLLADALGGSNSLRIKVFRICARLRTCVNGCVAGAAG